jgi:hypothetical protein
VSSTHASSSGWRVAPRGRARGLRGADQQRAGARFAAAAGDGGERLQRLDDPGPLGEVA